MGEVASQEPMTGAALAEYRTYVAECCGERIDVRHCDRWGCDNIVPLLTEIDRLRAALARAGKGQAALQSEVSSG